jgi:hypothetical protein
MQSQILSSFFFPELKKMTVECAGKLYEERYIQLSHSSNLISGKSYGLGARDLAKSAGASLRMQAPISQLSSGLKNVEKFNRKTE